MKCVWIFLGQNWNVYTSTMKQRLIIVGKEVTISFSKYVLNFDKKRSREDNIPTYIKSTFFLYKPCEELGKGLKTIRLIWGDTLFDMFVVVWEFVNGVKRLSSLSA